MSFGLIDSGSDVSVLSMQLANSLFRGQKWKHKIQKGKGNLTSFSNDSIDCAGEIWIKFKILPGDHIRKHKFILVNNPPSPLLFGSDFLLENKISLDYGKTPPTATFGDKDLVFNTIHIAPNVLNTVKISAWLEPNETKVLELSLSDHCRFGQSKDKIFVKESYLQDAIIYPSTSSHENGKCYCLISNLKNKKIHVEHLADIEFVNASQIKSNLKNIKGDTLLYKSPVISHPHLDQFLDPVPESATQETVMEGDLQRETLYFIDTQYNNRKMVVEKDKKELVRNDQSGNFRSEHINKIPLGRPEKRDILHQGAKHTLDTPNRSPNIENDLKQTGDSGINKTFPEELKTDSDSSDTHYNRSQLTYPKIKELDPRDFESQEDNEPPSPINDTFNAQGYEVPDLSDIPTIEQRIKDMQHDKYVEDGLIRIFTKYSQTVSMYSLDIGCISKTLGSYRLDVKPRAYFPTVNRSYFMHPEKRLHMETILKFMLRNKIIRRATNEDIEGCPFASASYLIEKSNKEESSYRAIFDFKFVNSQLTILPPQLPKLDSLIAQLRGAYLFSTLDLNNAFLQVNLHESSQKYTRFFFGQRSYVHMRLAMGLKSCPGFFSEIMAKIIDYEPQLDHEGKLIHDQKGEPVLKKNSLPNVLGYIDDIVCWSKFEKDLDTTYRLHMEAVERLIKRLADHSVKIGLTKCLFFRTSITWLGFTVSNNVVAVDSSRIQKLISAKIPESKKEMRSFCGLLQSLRQYTDADIATHMNTLTPLTSIAGKFEVEEKHRVAIQSIQRKLCEVPIFANIISKTADKVLFTDASCGNSRGFLAGVLTQCIDHEKPLPFADYLSPMDPCQKIAISFQLPAKPLLLPSEVNNKNAPNLRDIPVPYVHHLKHKNLGYTDDEVDHSLMLSLHAIQEHYKHPPLKESFLRAEAVKHVKSTTLKLKLKEIQFDNDEDKLRQFLDNFLDKGIPDNHEALLEGISKALKRKFYVIDSTPNATHSYFCVNEALLTNAWYLGKYWKNGKIIYRPFLNVKYEPVKPTHLNKKLELIAFHTKSLDKATSLRPILQLESLALIICLQKFSDYIKHSNLTVFIDNKAFFSIFLKDSTSFNLPPQLLRWATFIRTNYPNLRLQLVSTKDQLADFLSRSYKTYPRQLKTIKFADINISDKLNNYTPVDKVFTLTEFEDFVADNKHVLFEEQVQKGKSCLELTHKNKYIDEKNFLDTLFNARLSRENIISEQGKQFKFLIDKCLASDNFMYYRDQITYHLVNNMIMVSSNGHNSILLPDSLIGYALSYAHHVTSHGGINACMALLSSLSFPKKKERIERFLSCCFQCFFSKASNLELKAQCLPVGNFMGETVYIDFLQSLPPAEGFHHVLVLIDSLSHLIMAFPVKSITTDAVINILSFSIYPIFPVRNLISDNASIFTSEKFLNFCDTLMIRKPRIASLHPSANLSEIGVKLIKQLLKKLITTYPNRSWLSILPIAVKSLNASVREKGKIPPIAFLHGNSEETSKFDLYTKPYSESSCRSTNLAFVENRLKQNKEAIELIQEQMKLKQEKKLEEKPFIKAGTELRVNDIVFVRSNKKIPGVNNALTPKFSLDPYYVVAIKNNSAVVKRLGDGFQSCYNFALLKKFKKDDVDLSLIPPPLKNILLKGFDYINNVDIKVIRQLSPIDEPTWPNFNDDDYKKSFIPDFSHAELTPNDITPFNMKNLEKDMNETANKFKNEMNKIQFQNELDKNREEGTENLVDTGENSQEKTNSKSQIEEKGEILPEKDNISNEIESLSKQNNKSYAQQNDIPTLKDEFEPEINFKDEIKKIDIQTQRLEKERKKKNKIINKKSVASRTRSKIKNNELSDSGSESDENTNKNKKKVTFQLEPPPEDELKYAFNNFDNEDSDEGEEGNK